MFPLDVLQGDRTIDAIAGTERHKQHGFGRFRARQKPHSPFLLERYSIVVDQNALACADQFPVKPGKGIRLGIITLAFFQVIDDVRKFIGVIVFDDQNALGIEDFPDFIPHEIVDVLHRKFGSQPLLDTVNDGQLRIALLRLVEEPGVLEGHAHRVGQRLQQAHIAFCKSVLFICLDADDTRHFVIEQDGNTQIALVQVLFTVGGRGRHCTQFKLFFSRSS